MAVIFFTRVSFEGDKKEERGGVREGVSRGSCKKEELSKITKSEGKYLPSKRVAYKLSAKAQVDTHHLFFYFGFHA